jgi:hypothetical protein
LRGELLELAQRIRNELVNIEQVVERSRTAWQSFLDSDSDFFVDSAALNLHGFYCGVETLFETITIVVDGSRLEGGNWHQLLLASMATEIVAVRPAVISESSRIVLDNYRRFRHVVRHIYTTNIDITRLQPLVEDIPKVFSQIRFELLAFAVFLENQNDG